MIQTAFVCDNLKNIHSVYPQEVVDRIRDISQLYDVIITSENVREHLEQLREVDYFFSTWGYPVFSGEIIDEFKNLKCIFYAASSVKHFAEPYFDRGIRVVNAGYANGIFVAAYAYAQIELAAKGFFSHVRIGDGHLPYSVTVDNLLGSFHRKIGVIGAGNIGRKVVKKILGDNMIPYVYDPYLTEEGAAALGAKKASLEEIFAECMVISNHAPSTEETRGMMKEEHFRSMQSGATFINTGRGDSLMEEDFVKVFSERKDIFAVLDVVIKEPLHEESPINRLENVFRTPHIAGAMGSEHAVMAMFCVEELQRLITGQSLRYEVTREMLKLMT